MQQRARRKAPGVTGALSFACTRAMKLAEHGKLPLRGFSPKRLACALMVLSALLLPFHLWVDWREDEYITAVAFALLLGTLGLGLFIPRASDKNRFLPLALALVILVIHIFLCKL